MDVVDLITITPAMLLSSTCAEPAAGEVVWTDEGKALGDRVISTDTHRTYECIQAHDVGKDPTLAVNATYWLDVGPTMKWAMFDIEREAGTTSASPLVVSFAAGQRIGTLGAIGLDADTLRVDVIVNAAVIWTRTIQLVTRDVASYWDWVTAPFRVRERLALGDLPAYSAATITLTLTKASGDPTFGTLGVGLPEFIGTVKPGPRAPRRSFSTYDRSSGGAAVLIKRKSIPSPTMQLNIKGEDYARLDRLAARLDAKPALWIGLDSLESTAAEPLLLIGVYTRWDPEFTDPNNGTLDVALEGM